MAFMSYNGLKDGGTFKLDSTTKSTISADIKQIIGKPVAFTSTTKDPEVGYGSSDKPIAGIVTAIEQMEVGSTDYVVTVEWNSTFEDVPNDSDGTTAVAGGFVSVNGSGEVMASTTSSNAICIAVDGAKAIIRVL